MDGLTTKARTASRPARNRISWPMVVVVACVKIACFRYQCLFQGQERSLSVGGGSALLMILKSNISTC